VFDRDQRRFINDEGALVLPGIAKRISLAGFAERLHINGVYMEKRQWNGQQPTFLKYSKKENISLALFYRENKREWCITREDDMDATPMAVFHDFTPLGIYKRMSPIGNLLSNGGVWKDELDRTLKGRVV